MTDPAPIALLVRPGTYFEPDGHGGYRPADPGGACLYVESSTGGDVWLHPPFARPRRTGLTVTLRPCPGGLAMVMSAGTDAYYVDEDGRLIRKHDVHGGPHDRNPDDITCGETDEEATR